MAPDFKTYLATEIISEQKTVSYRTLSRALKIHVNAAKCMLYEFHERENKKKSGSVYATYLIAGTKKIENEPATRNGNATDANGDAPMPSSPPPYPSSFADSSQRTEPIVEERLQVPVKTITLVREEGLDTVKSEYEKITSIHIYSLSPGRLSDLQALTDVGRDLFATVFSKEDPLTHNHVYGVIQNPYVRRRKGKRPDNIDSRQPKPEQTKAGKSAQPQVAKAVGGTSVMNKVTAQPAASGAKNQDNVAGSRPSSRDSTSTIDSKSKPTLKRDGSSLFKAFAKQSGKAKLTRNDTDASATSEANSAGEDAKMIDADDQEGESEDEALFLDNNTRKPATSKKRASEVRKERDERAAKLRKMMDSDDEAEAEVPSVDAAAGLKGESNDPPAAKKGEDASEEEDVAWSDSDTESKPKDKTRKDEEVDNEPRRKRGKRKVMKKRTMKDEEGFLVTREEEVWESFSEDETESKSTSKPAAKTAFSGMKGQNATGSQKSAGSKAGSQTAATGKKKDIMAFFGKK